MSLLSITIALLALQIGGAGALFGSFWLLQQLAPELANNRWVVIPLGIVVVLVVIGTWGTLMRHLASRSDKDPQQ